MLRKGLFFWWWGLLRKNSQGPQRVAEFLKCKAAANPFSYCCLFGCVSHGADDDTTGNRSRSDAESGRFLKRQLSPDRWLWGPADRCVCWWSALSPRKLKGHLFWHTLLSRGFHLIAADASCLSDMCWQRQGDGVKCQGERMEGEKKKTLERKVFFFFKVMR